MDNLINLATKHVMLASIDPTHTIRHIVPHDGRNPAPAIEIAKESLYAQAERDILQDLLAHIESNPHAISLTCDRLVDMIYSIDHRKNWLIGADIHRDIRRLKDGDGRFAYRSSPTATEPDRLLGYPVYVHKALGRSILFGDISEGIQISSSSNSMTAVLEKERVEVELKFQLEIFAEFFVREDIVEP